MCGNLAGWMNIAVVKPTWTYQVKSPPTPFVDNGEEQHAIRMGKHWRPVRTYVAKACAGRVSGSYYRNPTLQILSPDSANFSIGLHGQVAMKRSGI